MPDADAYAVATGSGPAAVPALPAGDEAEPDTGQYGQAAGAAAQTPVFRMPGPGNVPRQRAVDHFQPEKEWHLQKPGGMRETAATAHPNGGLVKFAYADPPYLGCGKLYSEHPEARAWDEPGEHESLMLRLDRDYDGWAYSLSSVSLPELLPLAPAGIRIAAWVKPFAAFKRNVRIAYTWEPVIFRPGRDSSKLGAPVGRDHLAESITLRKGLTGAKPEKFCRWVLDLLGYLPGEDTLDDLFPGTGIMGKVLAS